MKDIAPLSVAGVLVLIRSYQEFEWFLWQHWVHLFIIVV